MSEAMQDPNVVTSDAPKSDKAKPKAKPKAKVEKKPAAKTVAKPKAKASTAPKSKPMSNDGKSVHADLPQQEVKFDGVGGERRVAILKAMKALGATGVTTAIPPDKIAAKAKIDDVKVVKIHLDVYRTGELLHNGYAKSTKSEEVRGNLYYLTAKGVKKASE